MTEGEPVALSVDPVLELRRHPRHVEAIEERAAVERERLLPLPRGERLVEGDDVAPKRLG